MQVRTTLTVSAFLSISYSSGIFTLDALGQTEDGPRPDHASRQEQQYQQDPRNFASGKVRGGHVLGGALGDGGLAVQGDEGPCETAEKDGEHADLLISHHPERMLKIDDIPDCLGR